MTPEQKLKEMGLTLPPAPKPAATYVTAVRSGNMLYTSGHVALRADGTRIEGKLGKDLTVEQGYEAAKATGLNLLATLKSVLGDLDRIKQVVRVVGMVNAAPDFTSHPQVVNGCSDLFGQVLGERGKHVRTAVGVGSLPFNVAVEIDVVVEVA
ncbi:MAG: RidA family protein [Chloroflexi bacterium]|nr:RidA family protein [Chloroflexota bacterium]